MGFFDSLGGTVNGLTFTGVTLNGRLVIVSDKLPVKSSKGEWVHMFEMPPDFDPIDGERTDILMMSKKMFDDTMSMVGDGDKVDALSTH